MKLGDSFQAYCVERAARAHTCVTGAYAKRSHKNSLRFQKRPEFVTTNHPHSVT